MADEANNSAAKVEANATKANTTQAHVNKTK